MTYAQSDTAPETSRSLAVRRTTTRLLRATAYRAEAAAGIGAILLFATAVAGAGPDWFHSHDLIPPMAVLALYGLATLLQEMLGSASTHIDPDARDGDTLFAAADVFTELREDLRAGADKNDVLIGLQASRVLPALHGTLAELTAAFAAEDLDEADDIDAAAQAVGDAAHALGEKHL
ncbi:hypothetical protein [Streptomyces sp. MP131-18]|uniref:hypothetical protein n=1 Tax=Streptomyces sp. MP131-18 TaxID=1857892 RepID=UPI00097BE8FA|nr:hypothetical protein [Streptomyces sp. MP131-18]ONK09274.1 hypothetical protein STBA_71290 [Streptomyces sp. MP131-18]